MTEQHRSLVKRIEVLENDRRAILDTGSRLSLGLDAAQPAKPNHPAKPDSSLVERVAAVIDNGTACDREDARIARDAIREVAAWMTSNPDHHFPPALVFALEQEAER